MKEAFVEVRKESKSWKGRAIFLPKETCQQARTKIESSGRGGEGVLKVDLTKR